MPTTHCTTCPGIGSAEHCNNTLPDDNTTSWLSKSFRKWACYNGNDKRRAGDMRLWRMQNTIRFSYLSSKWACYNGSQIQNNIAPNHIPHHIMYTWDTSTAIFSDLQRPNPKEDKAWKAWKAWWGARAWNRMDGMDGLWCHVTRLGEELGKCACCAMEMWGFVPVALSESQPSPASEPASRHSIPAANMAILYSILQHGKIWRAQARGTSLQCSVSRFSGMKEARHEDMTIWRRG